MGRWLWVVLLDGLLALAGAFLDISGAKDVPTWVWISMLAVGLLLAPFIAFHKLRLAADVAADAASTSAKEIFARLSKQAVLQKETRAVIIKRLREGRRLAAALNSAKDYESTQKAKEVGSWVTDTHHDLRKAHSLVLANRFGDASTMPFAWLSINNSIWHLKHFTDTRVKLLDEMKADIEKDR